MNNVTNLLAICLCSLRTLLQKLHIPYTVHYLLSITKSNDIMFLDITVPSGTTQQKSATTGASMKAEQPGKTSGQTSGSLTVSTLTKLLLLEDQKAFELSDISSSNRIVSKAVVGQNYDSQPILEIDCLPGQNIGLQGSEAEIRGSTVMARILALSNWDNTIPCVIPVEKSQALKSAMIAETMEEEKPYTDQWARLGRRLGFEQSNTQSPFVCLATDNGFALIPTPLAKVFEAFASSHVDTSEYLKVLAGISIGLVEANVLVVEDLYYRDPEDHSINAVGTDGMSGMTDEWLENIGVKRLDPVQFRAISKTVVEAARGYDWTEFNQSWKEFFNKAMDVGVIEAFLFRHVNWDKFDFPIESTTLTKLDAPPAFSVKSAKALMSSTIGNAKATWKSWGGDFVKKLKYWWNDNAPVIQVEEECDAHLFSKGAAMPFVDLDKQVRMAAETENGSRFNIAEIDMVTPRCNFKCNGKTVMKELGEGLYQTEMFVAVISQKSGGSMITTPHCYEAGGTGLFEDMSNNSVATFQLLLDEERDSLVFSLKAIKESANVVKMKSAVAGVISILEEGGYPEPINLQEARASINAGYWVSEEMAEDNYPGDSSHLLATSRGIESYQRKLAKQANQFMMTGNKRKCNRFQNLCLASWLKPGEIGVPSHFSKKWKKQGAFAKQPIANTANHQPVDFIFGDEDRQSQILKSMGLSRSVNIFFTPVEDAVNCYFADDDGDDGNASYILLEKKDDLDNMNQIVNILMASVKARRLIPTAAELPAMDLCAEKARGWRDCSLEDVSPQDLYGDMIGIFVNLGSLSNCAGDLFSLPEYEMDSVEFAISFSVWSSIDSQKELDAPKKDKPTMSFMACHEYKQINAEGMYYIPEEMIEAMKPWCLIVRNGEYWETMTMPCGKVVINPNCYDHETIEGGGTIIRLDDKIISESEYNMNLLWCNRDVLEKYFGSTPLYIRWFKSLILPKNTSANNYVTHFKTGWRRIDQRSLEIRSTKVGERFVKSVSPLAPISGGGAGLFASKSLLKGRSGFGVNLQTGKVEGPDHSYKGHRTLISVSHKVWLRAFWKKWLDTTGINAINLRTNFEAMIKRGQFLKKSDFFDALIGEHPFTKGKIEKKVFGENISEFEIFKTIIDTYIDEGLPTMSQEATISMFKKGVSDFNWKKPNGSFGSEAMIDLVLGIRGARLSNPDQIENALTSKFNAACFGRLKGQGKSIWTILLDYSLIEIQKRWELHSLPCSFGKILVEIPWGSIENNVRASQGLAIRVAGLHSSYTDGVSLSECRCCKNLLINGLKKLGRKEGDKLVAEQKELYSSFLTQMHLAFEKDVIQRVPLGSAKQKKEKMGRADRLAELILNDEWLSITDWLANPVSGFFGEFFTKGNQLNDRRHLGYGISAKNTTDKDGMVTDEDGATAMDYESKKPGSYSKGGYILLSPPSSKEQTQKWVDASVARSEQIGTTGRSGITIITTPSQVRTVEITAVPPVITTPVNVSNNEIEESYDCPFDDGPANVEDYFGYDGMDDGPFDDGEPANKDDYY